MSVQGTPPPSVGPAAGFTTPMSVKGSVSGGSIGSTPTQLQTPLELEESEYKYYVFVKSEVYQLHQGPNEKSLPFVYIEAIGHDGE